MLRRIRTAFAASRVTAAALAATLIMFGTLVAVSTPAHAVVPCPAAAVCTYWDSNYGGAMYYYTLPPTGCRLIGSPWNDQISSAFNRLNVQVTFYSGQFCDGWKTTLSAYCGCAFDRIAQLGWPTNDSWSSLWIGNDHP